MNFPRLLFAFCVATSAHIGTAHAQDQITDERTSLLLGTRLFDSVCRPSLGNPDEFHRLIGQAGLTKLSEDKGVAGETWGASVDRVSVAVQYTRTMTCFVYMSHATEEDVRMHVIKAIKVVFREGTSTVTNPPSESKDGSILRFNVSGPTGKYMLMALYRPGEPSLSRAALAIGPFK